MKEKDNVMAKEKWKFDGEVAKCFENMLQRSIPEYQMMRELTKRIGSDYLKGKGGFSLLDIGCSNGLSMKPFVEEFGLEGTYVGMDVSQPMLDEAINVLGGLSKDVFLLNHDIRNGLLKDEKFDLILSILTIQFTPIEYRQKIIRDVYNSLEDGGMFIMSEKILGSCFEIDDMLVNNYLNMKKENGYSEEQILRKKKSLEGVLVPMTSEWNKSMLKTAGFRAVDVFWRNLNFEAYVCIK